MASRLRHIDTTGLRFRYIDAKGDVSRGGGGARTCAGSCKQMEC